MMPSLRKRATLAQTDTWQKDSRLRLHHSCIAYVVEMVNKFGSENKYLCAESQEYTSSYVCILVYTLTFCFRLDVSVHIWMH